MYLTRSHERSSVRMKTTFGGLLGRPAGRASPRERPATSTQATATARIAPSSGRLSISAHRNRQARELGERSAGAVRTAARRAVGSAVDVAVVVTARVQRLRR